MTSRSNVGYRYDRKRTIRRRTIFGDMPYDSMVFVGRVYDMIYHRSDMFGEVVRYRRLRERYDEASFGEPKGQAAEALVAWAKSVSRRIGQLPTEPDE